ncbi:hypothetical protein [Brevundimonas sp.]|jgi:hypothetical protein|uniref:hypothetical protein n=1 Tax=Brevundimonas sp. TaxID=1871086 RepID=UPI0037BFF127
MRRVIAFVGLSLLSACATAPSREPAFVYPEGLKIMGEGYPYPGGPCRLLGETFATSELLDDSADLLGCPADAMQDPRVSSIGRVVGQYEGVTLISVPRSAIN